MSRKPSTDYINNKTFLEALRERRQQIEANELKGLPPPQISNYIGESIMHICKKLIYSPNFINYSFKEEMVDDAIFTSIVHVDKFDFDILSIKHEGVIVIENLANKTLIGKETGATAIVKSYNKKTNRIISKSVSGRFNQKEEATYINKDGQLVTIKLDGITYSNAFAYFTQCAYNAFIHRINTEKKETMTKAAIFQSASVNFLDIQDHDIDEDFANGFADYTVNNPLMNFDLSLKKPTKKQKTSISIEDII